MIAGPSRDTHGYSLQELYVWRAGLRHQLAVLDELRLAFIEHGQLQYFAFLKEGLEDELGMCSTLLAYYYLVL